MPKRSRKRISLASETVQTLTAAQIEVVVGGKAVTDALIRNPPGFSETCREWKLVLRVETLRSLGER